jgi:dimethylargininase
MGTRIARRWQGRDAMSVRFDRALVRPPAESFAAGLTTAGLGAPDLERALEQHAAYCRVLERCGLEVVRLEPDAAFPDSTFVEDAALVVGNRALLTRPGAPSRRGEVEALAPALSCFYSHPDRIEAPGTLDGGDVCETGDLVLVGRSQRTNDEGIRQLAAWLAVAGVRLEAIDIRDLPGCLHCLHCLHLKSGLSYLGEGRLAVVDELASHPPLQQPASFEQVVVDPAEAYAANCVRVNDRVLIAAGYPRFEAALAALGYSTEALDMSEFRKMDGGLSCLSLRLPPA